MEQIRVPFRHMEVDDSTIVVDGYASWLSLRVSAAQAGRRMNRKFSTRKTPDGIRVWRIQ